MVFDASVLIAHLNPADVHHLRASSLLRRLVADEFVASPLTLAEALVAPSRAGAADRAAGLLRELAIKTVELTAESPLRLATLRLDTGLKLPDCYVLHAAEQVDAAVATFDARLAQAARGRGIEVVTN